MGQPSEIASPIALIWKLAPSGSAIVVIRPKGESAGPSSTLAPSYRTLASACSVLSTPK